MSYLAAERGKLLLLCRTKQQSVAGCCYTNMSRYQRLIASYLPVSGQLLDRPGSMRARDELALEHALRCHRSDGWGYSTPTLGRTLICWAIASNTLHCVPVQLCFARTMLINCRLQDSSTPNLHEHAANTRNNVLSFRPL